MLDITVFSFKRSSLVFIPEIEKNEIFHTSLTTCLSSITWFYLRFVNSALG